MNVSRHRSKRWRLDAGHTLLSNFIELHYSISELAKFHRIRPSTALKLMCEAMTENDRKKVVREVRRRRKCKSS